MPDKFAIAGTATLPLQYRNTGFSSVLDWYPIKKQFVPVSNYLHAGTVKPLNTARVFIAKHWKGIASTSVTKILARVHTYALGRNREITAKNNHDKNKYPPCCPRSRRGS